MKIERMIELLKIEQECIARNIAGACDRNCGDCDLAQPDEALHQMYADVVWILEEKITKSKNSSILPCTCGFYRMEPKHLENKAEIVCPICGRIAEGDTMPEAVSKWNENILEKNLKNFQKGG